YGRDHMFLSNRCANLFDFPLPKVAEAPRRFAVCDREEKVFQNLAAGKGMRYLGMKLNAVAATFLIFECGDGRATRGCRGLKSSGTAENAVAVTGPYLLN